VYFFQGSEYRFKNSSGPRTEILRPGVSLADSCGATRPHSVCASTKSREVPVSHVGVTLSLSASLLSVTSSTKTNHVTPPPPLPLLPRSRAARGIPPSPNASRFFYRVRPDRIRCPPPSHHRRRRRRFGGSFSHSPSSPAAPRTARPFHEYFSPRPLARSGGCEGPARARPAFTPILLPPPPRSAAGRSPALASRSRS
jgi:hypothetical protein